MLQLLQRSETRNRFHYRSLVFPLHPKVLTMTTLTATVAKVNIASIEFEGLLLENGEYAIALQQAAIIFSVIPTSAPKWLETRLGKDSQLFQKVKTDRPKQDGKQNRAENALSLLQFEKLIRKLDREGNKTAQALVDDMVGFTKDLMGA